jgi:hypothetical protein
MVSIGDLIIAEHFLNIENDLNGIWSDKLFKLIQNVPLSLDKHFDARSLCTEYYISQIIEKLIIEPSSIENSNFIKILKVQGKLVRELSINIERKSKSFGISFWKSVLGNCPNLKRISLRLKKITWSLVTVLAVCANLFTDIQVIVELGVLQLTKNTFDDVDTLCYLPCLSNRKLNEDYKASRYICMKTESEFNLKGKSSLNEYLDPAKLESKREHIVQKTLPIELKFVAGDDTLQSLFISLCSEYVIPHIQKLSFQGLKLTTQNVQSLLQFINNPCVEKCTLIEFNVSDTGIGCIQLHDLFNNLSNSTLAKTLKSLNISKLLTNQDQLSAETMKTIGQKLHKFEVLQDLDLSYNYSPTIGMKQFIDALPLSTITKLNLSATNSSAVCNNLINWQKNRNFVEANLSNCQLNPRQTSQLLLKMKRNCLVLDLSTNRFDFNTMQALNGHLNGSCLKVLNISNINSLDYRVILKVLEEGKCLENIGLDNTGLDDKFLKKLADLFLNNQLVCIKKWSLMNNSIVGDGVVYFKSACARVFKNQTSFYEMHLNNNFIDGKIISRIQANVCQVGWDGVIFIFGCQRALE